MYYSLLRMSIMSIKKAVEEFPEMQPSVHPNNFISKSKVT